MKIKKIELIPRNDEMVYNLEIEDNHNYFVNGCLVKNCHQISQFADVSHFVKKLPTDVKIGMTGTLPDFLGDQWTVKGVLGPVIHSEEITKLQDDGYLANIKIHAIKIAHKKLEMKTDSPNNFVNEYNTFEHDLDTQKLIARICQSIKGNTLVLFDHTHHGKLLFSLINSPKKRFVNGEIDLDYREETRSTMETSEEDVLVVANCKCFGTGINIKRIHNIVFAMSGKSTVKIIQSIGRGLRKVEGKKHLNLVDIFHNLEYSLKHFAVRKKLYRKFYGIDLNEVTRIELRHDNRAASISNL